MTGIDTDRMAEISTYKSGSAAAGDTSLDLGALFRSQWRPLVRLAYLLTSDASAAEDIVQDAFVALQHNSNAPRDENVTAYLRRTVVNRSRSTLRHRYVVGRFLAAQHGAGPSEPGVAVDKDVTMLATLRSLPRQQREVLVLRYWADLPHADIADLLGLSVGAVKSTASRGLAALRTQMETRS